MLEHIQYIKNKVSKSVGILCKVQKYLDQQTLHNLYYTFVYPYLIYGVEIWGNACNVYLDPLVKLQKKCLRIITFSSYLEHTEPSKSRNLKFQTAGNSSHCYAHVQKF